MVSFHLFCPTKRAAIIHGARPFEIQKENLGYHKEDHYILREREDPWDVLANSSLELIARAREHVDQEF